MSFYTSLHFYRPSPPPRVTGPLLADFVGRLVVSGIVDVSAKHDVQVKFGRAIDQDDSDTVIYEPVPGLPRSFRVRSIEWDVEHSGITLDDLRAVLSNHDRPIYRASVGLGTTRPEIIAHLQTNRPDDGNPNLCLWDCGVHLGPVGIGSLGSDGEFMVGWMSLSLGGNGYLFPWGPRDLTSRAATDPHLRAAANVCRSMWPVDPDNSTGTFGKLAPALRRRRVRAARRRMGDLWPSDDLDLPWDWFWGVSETG